MSINTRSDERADDEDAGQPVAPQPTSAEARRDCTWCGRDHVTLVTPEEIEEFLLEIRADPPPFKVSIGASAHSRRCQCCTCHRRG